MGVFEQLSVIIHGMPGKIDTGGLLLHGHKLGFIEFRPLRDIHLCGALVFQHGKQAHLPLQVLFAAGGDGIHHGIVHADELASVAAQTVHCPAADQILHRPLVQFPIVHALQEVLQ